MTSIAIKFSFKYAEYKGLGYNSYNAFVLAADYFKRHLTKIVIHKQKEGITKVYFFSDQSSCIYNSEGMYFNFQTKKTLNK